NSDPGDDGAGGYGNNPPAIGIDFFQGPLADPGDGKDNDLDGCVDCTFSTDASGNQISVPDTVVAEQIIMSRFIKYVNDFSDYGNPQAIDDYYQYLDGFWKNGTPVTFGGTGIGGTTPCNYMFPGTTDPAFPGQNWTNAD